MACIKGGIPNVCYLRFGSEWRRLMNQLWGKVTLCTTPWKYTWYDMMNSPENLSMRLHK